MVTESPRVAHIWFGNRTQREITAKIESSTADTDKTTVRNYRRCVRAVWEYLWLTAVMDTTP